jgi:glycosyltransferase involved in cell wall biosynthesis
MTDRKRPDEVPGVCVVTPRGGKTPQNATYLLLDVLSELTEVSLVTVELSAESEIHGDYNVTEISQGSMGNNLLSTMFLFILNQIRMCKQMWSTDRQVIYFFGGLAYIVPVLFSKVIGKTVIVQPRGDVPLTLRLAWEEKYPSPLARFLASIVRLLEFLTARVSDRIVTYTPAMAEELGLDRFEEKLYADGTRYIEVENFVPMTPYVHRDRRVGIVGRLDLEKGVQDIAEAIQLTSEETEFLFVGDGELKGWLENELEEEIQDDRVQITGWVNHDQIPKYLNEIKLLVLASEPTEGLPTVIQEAFACGTPVYATPVSGIPDIVEENKTGFLMTDKNSEQIAVDIDRILNRNDLQEISENCRELAVDKYSFEASVERFEALLSTV